MYKFTAIVCLIISWVAVEALGAAIETRDDYEKKVVEDMKEAELTDTEIENLLAAYRKHRNSAFTPQRRRAVNVLICYTLRYNESYVFLSNKLLNICSMLHVKRLI